MVVYFASEKRRSKMRFLKEYFIIIVILIIVFYIDHATNQMLQDAVILMRDGITSIENKISENKEKEAQDEFDNLEKKWKEKSGKLALFVEHNELEKVSSNVEIIESNFKTNETEKVLENISELKFMLEHIEEKNQLKLKNIF